MPAAAWDCIASAAGWARAMADVFVDVHWIGGNPANSELYGTAAWVPRGGMVYLRNPSNGTSGANFMLTNILELPEDEAKKVFRVSITYASRGPSFKDRFSFNNVAVCSDSPDACEMDAAKRYHLILDAFEVMVFTVVPKE